MLCKNPTEAENQPDTQLRAQTELWESPPHLSLVPPPGQNSTSDWVISCLSYRSQLRSPIASGSARRQSSGTALASRRAEVAPLFWNRPSGLAPDPSRRGCHVHPSAGAHGHGVRALRRPAGSAGRARGQHGHAVPHRAGDRAGHRVPHHGDLPAAQEHAGGRLGWQSWWKRASAGDLRVAGSPLHPRSSACIPLPWEAAGVEVPPPPYPIPGRPQAGHPALHPWFPVCVCLTPWKTLRHGHTPLYPKSPPCIYLLLRVTTGGHPVMPMSPAWVCHLTWAIPDMVTPIFPRTVTQHASLPHPRRLLY